MLIDCCIFALDGEMWWKENSSHKTSDEYESEANALYQRGGRFRFEEAFKLFGKARSAAEAKGLMGKIPNLLLKMGRCQRMIANQCGHPKTRRDATLKSSFHMHLAVEASLSGRGECSQSEEWTWEAVKEAIEVARCFFDECLPNMDDRQRQLKEAIRFSFNSCKIVIKGHPFQDVTIFIHKEIAFLAFDLASDFLKKKDFQAGRQHLQTMATSIERAKDSYSLTYQGRKETVNELNALTEDYRVSCDIAQALEGMEAGQLIYSLAKKDLELNDVEYALNKGWDALDKFREVERLAQSTMDDVNLQAKAGQGLIYFDIFKMREKAKKIFTSVVEQTANKDFEWYTEAEKRLNAMAAMDPGFIAPFFKCTIHLILFQVYRRKQSWKNSDKN